MKLITYLIAGFLIAAAAVYFWPQPKLPDGEPVREFVIELLDSDSHPVSEETIQSEILTIRQRLLNAKITHEVATIPNSRQIVIRVADDDTAAQEEVKKLIQQRGILAFHLVHPNSERLADAVVAGDEYVAGYEVRTMDCLDENGAVSSTEYLLITRHPDMAGSLIKSANAGIIPGQAVLVYITFNKEGTEQFFKLTSDNVGRRLAIVIDDIIISAPSLRSPIAGGSAQIDGMASLAEAFDLANALESPLSYPMKLVEERTITQ